MAQLTKQTLVILFIIGIYTPEFIASKHMRRDGHHEVNWDYERHGSALWPHLKNTDCNKEEQSPINILDENVRCDKTLVKDLVMTDYHKPVEFKFVHNGHSISATPTENNDFPLLIEGSGLPQEFAPYQLKEFHFHWGFNYYEGSEHLINDKRFPLEMHLVHRSTLNNSIIAVVGVLMKLVHEDNPNLNELIEAATNLTEQGPVVIETLNLTNIINPSLNSLYFYKGSLTTPPCTQRVQWTVLTSHVGISRNQMEAFYENKIKRNFRYEQKLNKRIVYTNDMKRCKAEAKLVEIVNRNSAYKISITIFSLTLSVVLAYINCF